MFIDPRAVRYQNSLRLFQTQRPEYYLNINRVIPGKVSLDTESHHPIRLLFLGASNRAIASP